MIFMRKLIVLALALCFAFAANAQIGNLIKNQFLTARNWPFGAAISIFLIAMTFLLVRLYKRLGGKMEDLGGF